jgi:hypothetical protein
MLFENTVLKRIFGPKREEGAGEWRKLHNEELRDWYPTPSLIRIVSSRRMGWALHVARMGEKKNAYKLLVGKTEGKRLLIRTIRRWVDNMKVDLEDIRWGTVD